MDLEIVYTPEEEASMEELRRRTKSLLPSKMYEDFHLFYRFLKARDFNLSQAESMLQNHLIWRKSLQVDTLLEDFKPSKIFFRFFPSTIIGFDKQESLIFHFPVENLDGKGMFKAFNKFEIVKSWVWVFENVMKIGRQRSEKFGKTFRKNVLIFDCRNVSLALITDKAVIDFLIKIICLLQANYPEILKSIYVINASIYVTMIFPVIKAVLAHSILQKVQIFGKDGWQEELLKVVDADVLPVPLGGTRTDPDGNPLCKIIVNWGEKVPREYFLKKNIEEFANIPGSQKLTLPRMSSFETEINVEIAKSHIHWKFEAKNHDVGFKILFKENFKTTDVVSMYLYETEYEPIQGKLKCEKTGTYIVVFCNKHSWIHSKEVYYRLWVTNSDQTINDCME